MDKARKDAKGETEQKSYLLVHCRTVFWLKTKLGARNSTQVSHVDRGDLIYGIITIGISQNCKRQQGQDSKPGTLIDYMPSK